MLFGLRGYAGMGGSFYSDPSSSRVKVVLLDDATRIPVASLKRALVYAMDGVIVLSQLHILFHPATIPEQYLTIHSFLQIQQT